MRARACVLRCEEGSEGRFLCVPGLRKLTAGSLYLRVKFCLPRGAGEVWTWERTEVWTAGGVVGRVGHPCYPLTEGCLWRLRYQLWGQ